MQSASSNSQTTKTTIALMSSNISEQPKAAGVADTLHKGFHFSKMGDLLKNAAYSDMVICCGEQIYQVHKSIVCPRAGFFAAACDGSWKVCSVLQQVLG